MVIGHLTPLQITTHKQERPQVRLCLCAWAVTIERRFKDITHAHVQKNLWAKWWACSPQKKKKKEKKTANETGVHQVQVCLCMASVSVQEDHCDSHTSIGAQPWRRSCVTRDLHQSYICKSMTLLCLFLGFQLQHQVQTDDSTFLENSPISLLSSAAACCFGMWASQTRVASLHTKEINGTKVIKYTMDYLQS